MTNLERLSIEIKDIDYTDDEKSIFLQENSLQPADEYDPSSSLNKRNILKTALSILESLANNPMLMRNYKTESMSITDFADSLQNRIQMLDRKIRMIRLQEQAQSESSSFVYMFRN